MNQPLRANDPRLPAVRARLYALLRLALHRRLLDAAIGVGAPLQTWPFIHTAWHLALLETHLAALVETVLPTLAHALSAESERHRHETDTPHGHVDWHATLRHRLHAPQSQNVIQRRVLRSFDTPENRFVAFVLDWAEIVARQTAPHLAALGVVEGAHLLNTLRDLRRQPPWCWLPASGGALTPQEQARLSAITGRHPAYAALWRWWQQAQRFAQIEDEPHKSRLPEEDPDRLYEVLVLLELVLALSEEVPLVQQRPLFTTTPDYTAPTFTAETPHGALHLFYQRSAPLNTYRRLPTVRGLPDIVLQWAASGRMVLVDAKNYAPGHHSEALYKMLGYFYNFGYPDRFAAIAGGALAFSTEEREGRGLHAWHTGEGQALFSLVVPPLPDETYTGLREFVAWVLRATPAPSDGE
ncbi:MAG: hypothetical protein D6802_07565 [Ardenticatenia bacterium]|nr:MAG: hypothetical protein D6802_07565 [Ardenticatenia bacterium]